MLKWLYVAITIHLFQAAVVYTGHGYFGRFWETATYIISVMVDGHYLHFYKNKYNTLTPISLIHLFRPPHATKCEWLEQPAPLPTTDYIVISKSKSVLHSAFHPVLFIQPFHPLPPPPPPILLSPSSWASSKVKEKLKKWVEEKKRFEYPQQTIKQLLLTVQTIQSLACRAIAKNLKNLPALEVTIS